MVSDWSGLLSKSEVWDCKKIEVRSINKYFAMADLLSIPLEVHVLIVRELSLKDCIAYMQVCTVAHDVVYYVFAHRKELDVESVLDESGTCPVSTDVDEGFVCTHQGCEYYKFLLES